MFRLILVTFVFVLSATATDTNQHFPSLWNEAPSTIDDYPLVKDSLSSSIVVYHQINPWLYLHRLGLYKILILVTSPLMSFSVSSNASNILFGLASQFGWQFDSNRLFSNGTREVSTDSWWGSVNYYLSVIPFLAAVDVGLIRQSPFEIVPRENFCSSSEECFRQVPQPMIEWRLFFANLLQANYCPSPRVDDRMIDRCYLSPMWMGHVASLEHALPLIESKVSLLPSYNEQRFGVGWANLVGFIALTRKNTNLTETNKYQDAFLPNRMLREDDDPPHCDDLSPTVNQALHLLFSLRTEWYPHLTPVWKQATCNYEARQDAQRVMELVSLQKLKAARYFSQAILKSFLFKCD